MRMTRIGIISVCAVLLFALMGFWVYRSTQPTHRAAISQHATPSVSPPIQWATLDSPNAGRGNNELSGIASVDATHVWATGFSQDAATGIYRTLIEQWNGESWKLVASPNVGNTSNYLAGLSVVDAQHAWAVGAYQDGAADETRVLIERWDGTSWAVVPDPRAGSDSQFLYGVAAITPSNVWAVGKSQPMPLGAPQALIEHWDGQAWAVVPSLSPGAYNNQLFGIAAVNASDIWAVGEFQNRPGKGNETLIEHWDGTSWTIIPAPNPGDDNDVLAGISVSNAQDIWAVGYYKEGSVSNTLIEHWNGTAWATVPGHNPGDGDNELFSVDAVSGNDVWVVGNYLTGSDSLQTLIEHWNGHAWSFENSPNPGNGSNSLDGILVQDADHFLAVGEAHQDAVYQTLIVQGQRHP